MSNGDTDTTSAHHSHKRQCVVNDEDALAEIARIDSVFYRPNDSVSPFCVGSAVEQVQRVTPLHLTVISTHFSKVHAQAPRAADDREDEPLHTLKTSFLVEFISQCRQQHRHWHAWPLFFHDYSLPKIPDIPSGTVGCYEQHLRDAGNLVGVSRRAWTFLAEQCSLARVHIELCPPSPLADTGTLKEGSFYAYLTSTGEVVNKDTPIAYICVLTF